MVETKISYKLLLRMKEYIEDTEVQIDSEWGSGRDLNELLIDNDMPTIYNKVCELINNIKKNRIQK